MAFGEYKNRGIGRILHFAYSVSCDVDRAIFNSNNMVTLNGKPYLYYEWDDNEFNIPKLRYLGDHEYLNKVWAREKRTWLAYHPQGFNVKEYIEKYDRTLEGTPAFEECGWTKDKADFYGFYFVPRIKNLSLN